MTRNNKHRQVTEQPPREDQTPAQPVLRFTPTAWAKLLFFRDYQDTEIGGFGILAEDDPLLVEEFVTVKQDVTMASVAFDDDSVADFFDAQVDLGRRPEQFGRVWLHTHPGHSPTPSGTDEETFSRVFGNCQWAVMFILAQGGKSYARLRFNVGPGGHAAIPVEVDYFRPFDGSDTEAWQVEYETNISTGWARRKESKECFGYEGDCLAACSCPDEWIEELEAMEPDERRLVMAELSARPDLWEDCEVQDDFE
ncbi:MAG: hypothetical protein ACLFVU_09480 [Phycisphaerae bacterium]